MKRFKFKLQTVLNHRQKKEDVLKRELAVVKQRFEDEKHLLEQLRFKLLDIQTELRIKQKVMVDASEAVTYSNYMDRVERETEVQMVKVTDIAAEVRKTQGLLIEASKDRRVLEKLHDNQREDFKKELERIEQNSIDEIATIRQNHNQQNSLL